MADEHLKNHIKKVQDSAFYVKGRGKQEGKEVKRLFYWHITLWLYYKIVRKIIVKLLQ